MAIITQAQFLKGADPNKIKLVTPASENPGVPPSQQKEGGFFSNIASSAKERLSNVGDIFNRAGKSTSITEQNPLETGLQLAGQAAGFAGDVIGAGVSKVAGMANEATGGALKDVGVAILKTPVGQAGIDALQGGLESYNAWAKTNPRAAANLESVVNIDSILPASKVAETATKSLVDVTEQGLKKAPKLVSEITSKVPQYAEKATTLLASEPNEQVKTILKRVPKSKFDEFISIAEKRASDLEAPSGFEVVGEKIKDATLQLQNQMRSIGAQKSTIIEKANVGLEKFKDAPRRAILDVLKLEDNPLKQDFINKLKGVKTKLDADRAIDYLQDKIFSSTRTNVIASGSAVEKRLSGILGKLNGELKETLPKSYQTLNAKYSNRKKIIDTLNTALGEVVDGVPTRGASLIKQFFSPSGSKTKELFEYIKKNTGIDLAEDAVLAKFTGELFEDPNVRSLLQGIPTSKSGAIGKVVDFTVEKTGLGKKTQDIIRKGTIKKARSLAR